MHLSRSTFTSCKVIRQAFAVFLLIVIGFGIDRIDAFSFQPAGSSVVHLSRPALCRDRRKILWPLQTRQNQRASFHRLHSQFWEGDDVRWVRKLRRRIRKLSGSPPPARTTLVILNISFFIYQVVNAVGHVRQRYPSYWPSEAPSIVTDVALGRSITGPFTMDFAHSVSLSRYQPHRYLTAGFLHGGLLHLVVNLDALLALPTWLESGLGWPLYLTTYLLSIVAGNLAHRKPSSLCVGASGGICGLYGLLFSAMQKMGNSGASASILRGMAFLVLTGLFSDRISNASHVGGFFGGLVIGYLCGPRYRKSYSMRRKWSLDVDEAPRDYRRAMGFGKTPTRDAPVPIQLVWVAAFLAILSQPKLKSIPRLVWNGLLHPGSLGGVKHF